MSELVYFNGILVPDREVLLPITDRSYLYGEGLFESMKATRGFIPFLPEHLRRLLRGAEILEFNFELNPAKLEFTVYQTLLHNHLKEAYLRLTLSQANESLGSLKTNGKPHLLVAVRPLQKLPDKVYETGLAARVCTQFKIFPDKLCQVKSTNYLRPLMAKREAQREGADEAILLNTEGRVVEGASANLFLFNGHRWVTPSLSEGPLPGVIRGVLLELMRRNEIPFEERPVELKELREAREAFFSNAVHGIIPLIRLEEAPIAGGEVGKETRRLMGLLQEEIQYRFEQFESKTWFAKKSV